MRLDIPAACVANAVPLPRGIVMGPIDHSPALEVTAPAIDARSAADAPSAGDPIPVPCVLIEVHVGELRQLFNAIDPSPFRERDLDPQADEFIVGWAREAPREARLGLLVHLDRPPGLAHEAAELGDAVRKYFAYRAQVTRRRLRLLLERGRTSLLIGLVTLTASLLLGDLAAKLLAGRRAADLLRESLLIGGWVAMWRPLEVFLYDWWPIRAEASLYDRLGSMPVRIKYKGDARPDPETWRRDWPAVPAGQKTSPAGPSSDHA
jgi:hypothetical protein